MLNFYKFYNKTGLDNEHYDLLINWIVGGVYLRDESKPIEHIIKKSPQHAYWYARTVIKGRWKEAEPYIMKDSKWAYSYARVIMKDRWIEAEPYIKQSKFDWSCYCSWF